MLETLAAVVVLIAVVALQLYAIACEAMLQRLPELIEDGAEAGDRRDSRVRATALRATREARSATISPDASKL